MLFDSIHYLIFLSIVFVLNYLLPHKFRWVLLLVASLYFYLVAGASTIFVALIIVISTFICGLLLDRGKNAKTKKFYLLIGLFINLGLLAFFKYINFFIATSFDGFNMMHHFVNTGEVFDKTPIVLTLLVPLGISYITFQAIGYLIEINRGNYSAERNLGLFTTYLLFFPKLLSGPIERAHNFLPQLLQKHDFDYSQVVQGLKRILWGLFLKLVVANRLALYTSAVFSTSEQHTGITLLVAAVFFMFQLFADFGGYTEMAIGSAQILGFRLMENFNNPFVSKSTTELWRRWHISLSTWFSDYVFNPIVIDKRDWNRWSVVYASFVTFLLLGFWHGANWNFLIFGFLQALVLSLEFLTKKSRKKLRNHFPDFVNNIVGVLYVIAFFSFSLIFFNINDTNTAFSIIKKIFTFRGSFYFDSPSLILYSVIGIFTLLLVQYKREYYKGNFSFTNNKSWIVRYFIYCSLILLILLIGVFDGGQFIYFKF